MILLQHIDKYFDCVRNIDCLALCEWIWMLLCNSHVHLSPSYGEEYYSTRRSYTIVRSELLVVEKKANNVCGTIHVDSVANFI